MSVVITLRRCFSLQMFTWNLPPQTTTTTTTHVCHECCYGNIRKGINTQSKNCPWAGCKIGTWCDKLENSKRPLLPCLAIPFVLVSSVWLINVPAESKCPSLCIPLGTWSWWGLFLSLSWNASHKKTNNNKKVSLLDFQRLSTHP